MSPTHVTIRCPHCGHAASGPVARVAFCPHCGRRLRRRRSVVWPLVVLGVVGGLRWSHPTATARHRADARLVASVESVLAADEDAQAARAADLARRGDAVRAARQALADQADVLSNLAARVATAAARAADEGRWPARVAGRSLLRADADALLARIGRTLAVERRAVARDDAVLAEIDVEAQAVHDAAASIADLHRQLDGNPSAAAVGGTSRQAAAFRDADTGRPDVARLTADQTRPVNLDVLLK